MYYANSAQDMFILPGRLRISIKGLRGNAKFAERINGRLSDTAGIEHAAASRHTGNVLVFFYKEQIDAAAIKRLIYEAAHPADAALPEAVRHPADIGNLQAVRNVDRVYSKAVPIVIAASSFFFAASANLLAPLAILALIHPYMVYLSSRITLRSAAAAAESKGIRIIEPSKLETAADTDIVVFDGTGLLTGGSCKVEAIVPAGRYSENRVVALAASCWQNRDEPLAKALLEEASHRRLELKEASNMRIGRDGRTTCSIDGKEVLIGNKRQLSGKNLIGGMNPVSERRLRQSGQYPVYVALNRKIIGLIGFTCSVDDSSIRAVEALRETGVEEIALISEESPEAMGNIAFEAGIDSCSSDLSLEDMAESVSDFKACGKRVAIITGRHCNIPGNAADIVISFSDAHDSPAERKPDFVITQKDLRLAPELINLGKYSREVVLQNCIISLGADAIGVIAVFAGILTPYWAVFYKLASSIIVLLNASRPAYYKIQVNAGG